MHVVHPYFSWAILLWQLSPLGFLVLLTPLAMRFRQGYKRWHREAYWWEYED